MSDIRWITADEVAENYAPIGSGGGIGGSIADQQVAFGSGTDISGSDSLQWDNNNILLTLGEGNLEIDGNNSQIRLASVVALAFGSNQIKLGNPDGGQGVKIDASSVTIGVSGQTFTVALAADQFEVSGVPIHLDPQAQPSSPQEGMIYAGTDHHLYYYNGTAWKQLDN